MVERKVITKPEELAKDLEKEVERIQPILEKKFNCKLAWTGRVKIRDGVAHPSFLLIYSKEDLEG